MGTGGGFTLRCVLLAFFLGALIGGFMISLGGKVPSSIECEPLQRKNAMLAEIGKAYPSENTIKQPSAAKKYLSENTQKQASATVLEDTPGSPTSQSSDSMMKWQAVGESQLGSDITFTDAFLNDKVGAIRWPPAACKSRDGALKVLCADSAISRRLWVLGLELLGEESFVKFAMRLESNTTKLGRRPVTMWSDTKFTIKHVQHDQEKDAYNFGKHCQGADASSWFIDFGGNIGYAAVHMWLRSPVGRIITVEPSPWNYFLLRLNVATNSNDGRIVALKAGISSTPGWLSGEYRSHRTALSTVKDATGQYETFKTRTITFQSVIDGFGVKRIHVFKLDCEGCEWDALEWKRAGIWDKVKQCVGEFHIFCQAMDSHGKPICGTGKKITDVPKSLPVDKAKAIWTLLCKSPNIHMPGDSTCHPLGCQCPISLSWT